MKKLLTLPGMEVSMKDKAMYVSNHIGSGKYCECGRELTHEEYNNQKQYKHKMCGKCNNDYCDHAITGH